MMHKHKPHKPAPINGLSLGALRPGQAARVRALAGGRSYLSRLASLGFTPGARLAVIQNYGHGPLIVAVRDTRVALGRGEAEGVLVELLTGRDDG